MGKIEHNSYRTDVDGLRGLAIILVVLFHLFPNEAPNGYLGVDIFFVISGYLISSSVIRDLNKNQFSWKSFIQKRIKRIIPALISTLYISTILGVIILSPNELVQLAKDIIRSLAFSINFFCNMILDIFQKKI